MAGDKAYLRMIVPAGRSTFPAKEATVLIPFHICLDLTFTGYALGLFSGSVCILAKSYELQAPY